MVRRSALPMQLAARRLPWHVSVLTAAPGYGHQVDQLLAWCRRLPRDAWFYPLPGGRTASGATDFAVFGFLERADAEAFAAVALQQLGEAAGVRVLDSRAAKVPPWQG